METQQSPADSITVAEEPVPGPKETVDAQRHNANASVLDADAAQTGDHDGQPEQPEQGSGMEKVIPDSKMDCRMLSAKSLQATVQPATHASPEAPISGYILIRVERMQLQCWNLSHLPPVTTLAEVHVYQVPAWRKAVTKDAQLPGTHVCCMPDLRTLPQVMVVSKSLQRTVLWLGRVHCVLNQGTSCLTQSWLPALDMVASLHGVLLRCCLS